MLAIHESVAYVLARALGGAPRRRVAIVWIDGRRRVALALVGAAAAGYLAVSALALGYYASHGVPTGRGWWSVGEVKDGMPAAGMLVAGDRVIALDGKQLQYQDSLAQLVNDRGGAAVTLTIQRDGAQRDVTIQPARNSDRWVMGIVPRIEHETEGGLGAMVAASAVYPAIGTRQLARELIRSLTPAHADPGGPKRIIDEFTVRTDAAIGWAWFLRTTVVLLLALVVLDLVRAGRLVVLGSAA